LPLNWENKAAKSKNARFFTVKNHEKIGISAKNKIRLLAEIKTQPIHLSNKTAK